MTGPRRIVVKIGSALLVDDGAEGGPNLRGPWLEALADDIAILHRRGIDVLVVSSGAIAVGRASLGLAPSKVRRPLTLEEKQASAATGQIRLAHAYQNALARHGIVVAQLLLTIDDTEQRRRHLNARSTVGALLKRRVVPVINENDTVATQEIRFGDNDRLAARVAQMASADTLVLLSDIDGLYDRDPRVDPAATYLPEVSAITPEIEAMAGAARPGYSSGGMVTKLAAAKVAMAAGCRMAIADGRSEHALAAVMDGGRCTWFVPRETPLTARKQWIVGSLKPVGGLTVDAGAARALLAGRSLLPAGVTAVEGRFERGDPVIVRDAAGGELGRGLIAYDADDTRMIIGHRSEEIEQLLGFRGRSELIHRDDLVLTATEPR